jgi:hypothetical protein
MTDRNRLSEKKQYQTPKVTVISLRPEEAVLGNCKTATTGGPNLGGVCANNGGCTPLAS